MLSIDNKRSKLLMERYRTDEDFRKKCVKRQRQYYWNNVKKQSVPSSTNLINEEELKKTAVLRVVVFTHKGQERRMQNVATYSVSDLARIFRVQQLTFYKWIWKGKIPGPAARVVGRKNYYVYVEREVKYLVDVFRRKLTDSVYFRNKELVAEIQKGIEKIRASITNNKKGVRQ